MLSLIKMIIVKLYIGVQRGVQRKDWPWKHGCRDLICDIFMYSFWDIVKNVFFDDGGAYYVIWDLRPRPKPGSNAFLWCPDKTLVRSPYKRTGKQNWQGKTNTFVSSNCYFVPSKYCFFHSKWFCYLETLFQLPSKSFHYLKILVRSLRILFLSLQMISLPRNIISFPRNIKKP